MFDVYFKIVILSIDYNSKKIGVWLNEKKEIPSCMAFPKTFAAQIANLLKVELGLTYDWIKPKQFITLINDDKLYISFVGMCPSETIPLKGKLYFDLDEQEFNKIDRELLQKAKQWVS